MSSIRYVDTGIQCNGCLNIVYASNANVENRAVLIRYLRRKGWQVSRARKDAWDLCPACARKAVKR